MSRQCMVGECYFNSMFMYDVVSLTLSMQEGAGLAELETIRENLQHMKNVGFEIVEWRDLVELSEIAW